MRLADKYRQPNKPDLASSPTLRELREGVAFASGRLASAETHLAAEDGDGDCGPDCAACEHCADLARSLDLPVEHVNAQMTASLRATLPAMRLVLAEMASMLEVAEMAFTLEVMVDADRDGRATEDGS